MPEDYISPDTHAFTSMHPFVGIPTQLGTKTERFNEFNRLNWLNNLPSHIEELKHKIKTEIRRFIGMLKIPISPYELIKPAMDFYNQLPKGTKARSIDCFIPIVIFIECLERFIAINRKDFIELLHIDYKKFNYTLRQYYTLNPKIFRKHKSDEFRKRWIFTLLSGIKSQFDLNDGYLYTATQYLHDYFTPLKNRKDAVIAALLSELVRRGPCRDYRNPCIVCRQSDRAEVCRHDIVNSHVCRWLGLVPSVINSNHDLLGTIAEVIPL